MSAPLGKVAPLASLAAPPDSPPTAPRPEVALEELRVRQATHPFWDNRLLQACRQGQLSREDFALVLSQDYLHQRATSRWLHALLANCEHEGARAHLARLLGEESSAPPEQRPVELLRRLLCEGLEVDVEALQPHDATRLFARECLDFCLRSGSAAASAFLALGTESLLPRLSSVFCEGLLQAGVPERHLGFFHHHMASDGARAQVLEELMLAHAGEPGWYACSLRAMERALALRGAFLDALLRGVPQRRVGALLERMQRGQAPERPEPHTIHLEDITRGEPLFRAAHAWHGIDFTVERVPLGGEVLEARLVRVAAGLRGDPWRSAHETLLAVLSGSGRVRVNATEVEVRPGHLVFVPRWAWHQAHSTGEDELTLLAVTDRGLATRAQLGSHPEESGQPQSLRGPG